MEWNSNVEWNTAYFFSVQNCVDFLCVVFDLGLFDDLKSKKSLETDENWHFYRILRWNFSFLLKIVKNWLNGFKKLNLDFRTFKSLNNFHLKEKSFLHLFLSLFLLHVKIYAFDR